MRSIPTNCMIYGACSYLQCYCIRLNWMGAIYFNLVNSFFRKINNKKEKSYVKKNNSNEEILSHSLVIDENVEPKVVYHQTNATVYINRETGQNWDELDWRERMEWDDRDDWDDYWEEREFNTFSRVNARTTNEFDGFFFAPEYDEYHEYGDRTIEAFLNIENPAFLPSLRCVRLAKNFFSRPLLNYIRYRL